MQINLNLKFLILLARYYLLVATTVFLHKKAVLLCLRYKLSAKTTLIK